MFDQFYNLLASRISPELITAPTMVESQEAQNDIKSKEQFSSLGNTRSAERSWKAGQRRSLISRSSLFLNKKPDLTRPMTPINTVSPTSLLGSTNRN